jgi:proteic killer suppression protein
MRFRHADKTLQRLDEEPRFNAGYAKAIVETFRARMQLIRDAADERDLYAFKSLHYEKLKGDRKHQRSMRLNKQFRLILEIEPHEQGNVVVIVAIEDYH